MKNQLDKDGEMHGPWESYYPDGQIYSKDTYHHGITIGLSERYYDDGKLWCKGIVQNARRFGLWEDYDSHGNISIKGRWKPAYSLYGKRCGLFFESWYNK